MNTDTNIYHIRYKYDNTSIFKNLKYDTPVNLQLMSDKPTNNNTMCPLVELWFKNWLNFFATRAKMKYGQIGGF